jgi:hypothetical protein
MWKIATAGVTALFVIASPLAYAQSDKSDRLSAADWDNLTDVRIGLIKGALQLTPDQMKYWPTIEQAIRARAKNRQARVEKIEETVGSARSAASPMEVLRNRDPVAFLNRRADALAQRSADLKKLAEAWQPLYATLQPDQKRRMAALSVFALREMSDAVERRLYADDDDD